MLWQLVKFLAAAALLTMSSWSSAAVNKIDIFDELGVPGTGGYQTVVGPCYCEESAWLSPVMLLKPGEYDFGSVRQYWILSGFTPDAGPDQPYLWLLFSSVVVSGSYPENFQSPPTNQYPGLGFCAQGDDACNASYASAYADSELLYTVAPGENAVQVELIGNYRYTSPLPEPASYATLVLGLAVLVRIAKKRSLLKRF